MKPLAQKKAKKLQDILLSAQHVFAEKGFHKATVDEIAEGANVAKGTVYLYFPDKLALFEHILKEFLNEYKSAYEKLLDMDDILLALRLYIEARFKVYTENANLVRITLQSNLVDVASTETKSNLLAIQKYHIEIAEQIISKGIVHHIIGYRDALTASVALNGIINQFALYKILTTTNIGIQELTTEILHIFLNGVMAKN